MGDVILASASYDHSIKLWEVESGKSYRSIKHNTSQINKMCVSVDNKHLACGGNPNILVFDVEASTQSPVSSYEGHSSNVTGLGYHKDGNWMYSSSEDNTVKIWDIRAKGTQREMDNLASVNDVVLHPNQVELISGDQSGSIRVWDLRTNTCSKALVPAGKQRIPIRSLSISANGKRVVAANNNGQCFVWRLVGQNAEQFEPYTKLESHSTYVTDISISPNCKFMATSSADHTVKVFDMKHFKAVAVLKGHTDWVWGIQWSVDSQFLMSCSSDASLKLWDVKKASVVRTYNGHSKTVCSLALQDVQV